MGGDTRHFATLAEDLKGAAGFQLTLINTSRGDNHGSPLHNFWVATRTVMAVAAGLFRADILSFHASDRGMVTFGPLIRCMSRVAGVPTIFRVFGGSFGDFYEQAGSITKWVIRKFVLSSDVVLLQTQRLIQQLSPAARGALVWFSTYIRQVSRPNGLTDNTRCTRFVFLGHLWRTKGVEVMLEAASRFPPGCTIDLYGPLDEYTPEQIAERGKGRIRYCRFLSHAEVEATLWNYDCLVLPTFHPGEGYPGVIAEAFAHGLPVITTNWLAIPEMVDEHSALLIEPSNAQALADAIAALNGDPDLWRRLQAGATRRAAQFDHSVWAKKFEEICEQRIRN